MLLNFAKKSMKKVTNTNFKRKYIEAKNNNEQKKQRNVLQTAWNSSLLETVKLQQIFNIHFFLNQQNDYFKQLGSISFPMKL